MTNLLKDLFKEIKNIDRTKLKKFAEISCLHGRQAFHWKRIWNRGI